MLKLGAHLKSNRGFYTHHGIYIGNEEVIHYSGLSENLQKGKIEKVSLSEFSGKIGYDIIKHDNIQYSSTEIVNRAKSRLGEDAYHFITNNCEHFVNWCIENKHSSTQAFMSQPFDKNKQKEISCSIDKYNDLVKFREDKLKKFF